MKILLANNTFSILGGSETFYLVLGKELAKKHQVSAYSPLLGIIANKLRREGIECYFKIPNEKYDLIIASHYHIVDNLRLAFPETPIISVIHSPMHIVDDYKKTWSLEHPAIRSKVNKYVAVSEEVKDKLKKDYNIDSTIIRNFFEIDDQPIDDKPKRILFNSNYNKQDDQVFKIVVDVANHYQAELLAIGEGFFQTPNVKEAIKQSDMVFGIGRSVLEGMAMGRLGVVHGRWGTGGVVCKDNIGELAHYNFSGRNNYNKWQSPAELIKQIDAHYKEKDWRINYMRTEHNVELAAEKFLCLLA